MKRPTTLEEAFAMPELPVSIRLDDIAVGEVIVTRDGRPLPMTITDVGAALALGPEHGQLWLRDVNIATDSIEASAEGEVSVQALHHPFWPMSVDLDVRANGLRPRPRCACEVCCQPCRHRRTAKFQQRTAIFLSRAG